MFKLPKSLWISFLSIILSNFFVLLFVNQYAELLTIVWVFIVNTIIWLLLGFIEVLKLREIYKTNWERSSKELTVTRPLKGIIAGLYLLQSAVWMVAVLGFSVFGIFKLKLTPALGFIPVDIPTVLLMGFVFIVGLAFRKTPLKKELSFGRIMLTPFLRMMPLFLLAVFVVLEGSKMLVAFVLLKTIADIIVEVIERRY